MALVSLGVILPVAAGLIALPYIVAAPDIPPHFGSEVTVEKLYKDSGKVVDSSIMSVSAAEQACPKGSQMVRQSTREDGAKTYLVWTLRCR